jgi:hypothetical protein
MCGALTTDRPSVAAIDDGAAPLENRPTKKLNQKPFGVI